jgi:hypothetical protein
VNVLSKGENIHNYKYCIHSCKSHSRLLVEHSQLKNEEKHLELQLQNVYKTFTTAA